MSARETAVKDYRWTMFMVITTNDRFCQGSTKYFNIFFKF